MTRMNLIAELRRELEDEWAYNHAEHCTNDWPHPGRCHWPRPPVLELREVKALPKLPPFTDPPYLRRILVDWLDRHGDKP